MAERFSFYGMRSILLAYMTLIFASRAAVVMFSRTKQRRHGFTCLLESAYLFPILGGLIADALGKIQTILILSLVYCLGHGFLACMEWVGDTKVMLIGLGLIAIGSGGIKPCVLLMLAISLVLLTKDCCPRSLVGFIYQSIWGHFSGILTPVFIRGKTVTGTVGEDIYPYFIWLVGQRADGELIFGHHYAFGFSGVLMAFATFISWMGRRQFAHIAPEGAVYFSQLIKKVNLLSLARLWIVFSFVVLFWALFDQIGTLWQVQPQK